MVRRAHPLSRIPALFVAFLAGAVALGLLSAGIALPGVAGLGRLAIADIVTDQQLPEGVVCNADLWAACIGGAAQRDEYRAAIEGAGLRIETIEENAGYRFISARAQRATAKWGVKSVSILAVKP